MICPTCQNLMIVVEHQQIELDYCPDCSGVWFDAGELELMLERMGLEESGPSLSGIFTSPEAMTAEKKRRCPICHRKMEKATIGKEPEVIIDRCPARDGLWFDGGEVGHLIAQWAGKPEAESGSREGILNFLGDTFKGNDNPEPE